MPNFGSSASGVVAIIAIVLALVATVLAFIFIVPEKRRAKLNGFGRFLHDTVNFKYLVVEKIFQAIYILSTVYIIIYGFCMLFVVVDTWGGSEWLGGYGLLLMILGPIVIRLIYEFTMMAIILVKNVISINNKLKNKNGTAKEKDVFAAPDLSGIKKPAETPAPAPVPTAQPKAFCPNCGAPVNPGEFCINCGTKC